MPTKGNRTKQAAPDFPVPQTRENAVAAIGEMGRIERELTRIQTAMNDRIAKIKEQYEEKALPHKERHAALQKGVQTWAEAHRDELTQGGKVKHAELSSGKIEWRLRPKSVTVRGVQKVIEALKALGLPEFIRTKEEVNKEAILQDTEKVKHVGGISISQREDFIITPFSVDLEEEATA